MGKKPRIKLSEDVEKVTMPGKKQVFRLFGQDGKSIVNFKFRFSISHSILSLLFLPNLVSMSLTWGFVKSGYLCITLLLMYSLSHFITHTPLYPFSFLLSLYIFISLTLSFALTLPLTLLCLSFSLKYSLFHNPQNLIVPLPCPNLNSQTVPIRLLKASLFNAYVDRKCTGWPPDPPRRKATRAT